MSEPKVIYTALLIEDSKADATLFCIDVANSPLRDELVVSHAASFSGGLAVLDQKKIDIIILDFHLPDSDGLTSTRLLFEKFPHIPILILTGQEDDWLGMKAVELGAQDYLIKGDLSPTGLSRVVRYAIHRKKTENDLRQAQEKALKNADFQKQFLASMSHEIRSPLNSILGFLDLLRDPSLAPTVRDQYLNIANSASELLLSLVNDILDATAIQNGQLMMNFELFRLRETIDLTMAILINRAQQKGLRLSYVLGDSLPEQIYGDQRRLQQILLNLVGNAIKFTVSGEIKLEVSLISGAGIRFVVTDTGIGIPANQMDRLFAKFEQLNPAIGKKFGGSGLGLYISQELAHRMDSVIIARSDYGKGSEFEFTIPFREGTCQKIQAEALHIEQLPKQLRILVIDDAPDVAVIVRAYLNKVVHSVKAARCGGEGLAMLQEESFDLVVLDMQMPEMSGYETAIAIRKGEAENKSRRLPILALSGSVLKEEVERSKAAGCDLFVGKPFKQKDLLVALSRLFSAAETADPESEGNLTHQSEG